MERELSEDPSLSDGELRIYVILCNHANENGLAWPELATLVKETGHDRKTIQRYIKKLKERGLVEVTKRIENGVQKSNRYFLPRFATMKRATRRGASKPPLEIDPLYITGERQGNAEDDPAAVYTLLESVRASHLTTAA